MKALDYILNGMESSISYDELGNLYIDDSGLSYCQQDRLDILSKNWDNTVFFISKEDCDKYNEYEIIIPDDIDYDDNVRRPYYRMRGKPVTKDQAFDIIRRTDNFFSSIDEIGAHDDFVGSYNFDNWLINENHYPKGYGWIHTDGAVGSNSITQKYPDLNEFIDEWLNKLLAFPYLDLVIAVTDWDEISPELWQLSWNDASYDSKRKEFEIEDKNFCKAVVLGIYIHDKTLEILRPVDAVRKYKEYSLLYGKDKEKYIPEYYQSRGIKQVDLPYLKRCIEAYDLDADKVLSEISAHEWKEN